MLISVTLLGHTITLALEPAAGCDCDTNALDGGTLYSQPISFLPQQPAPMEWQPPERTQPWDEPDDRG